jgi:hypothetical protein
MKLVTYNGPEEGGEYSTRLIIEKDGGGIVTLPVGSEVECSDNEAKRASAVEGHSVSVKDAPGGRSSGSASGDNGD